jgi:thiosulfate dehydrogenase [quinone] large subunit
MQAVEIPEPNFSKFIFSDTRFAWFWLLVRLYVGWEWVSAGWEKLQNPAWVGPHAGGAVEGVLRGALAQASGLHPNVQPWYAGFIASFALHHVAAFSYLVSYGEFLVGVALILGIFTGIAAFFGSFMNMNYLLAGAVSTNPILLVLELLLILAWRVSGWYGLDRYVLPALGTPWKPGKAFAPKN